MNKMQLETQSSLQKRSVQRMAERPPRPAQQEICRFSLCGQEAKHTTQLGCDGCYSKGRPSMSSVKTLCGPHRQWARIARFGSTPWIADLATMQICRFQSYPCHAISCQRLWLPTSADLEQLGHAQAEA